MAANPAAENMAQVAFSTVFGSFGNFYVAICLLFFAFSTIIGWYFFGEQNIKYLFGTKGTTPYRLIVMGFIVLGSVLQVDLVWELADMFNGLMVLPNLIASSGFPRSSAWRSETTTRTIPADPPAAQTPKPAGQPAGFLHCSARLRERMRVFNANSL